MSKGKYILTGFLVGGVVSAAVTLLTTPTSGEQLRYRVKEQGTEWYSTVEDIIRDAAKIKEQFAKTSKEGIALINENNVIVEKNEMDIEKRENIENIPLLPTEIKEKFVEDIKNNRI